MKSSGIIKRVGLGVLLCLALGATARLAVASSDYDQTALDYIQEGENIVFNEAETYGDESLWYAYVYAYYAEVLAEYAIDYNYRDAWYYAALLADYAAEYASESENDTGYGPDALGQGAQYAYYAYLYFYSTTDFFDQSGFPY